MLKEDNEQNNDNYQKQNGQHNNRDVGHTANMCSGITVEVHLKNCNFEKLQFFTVDLCSLYFLQVKNCKFNTIFM